VPPSPTITVIRGRFGPAAAQVLEQVRAIGVAHRDELASSTELSLATVGRVVGQLTDARVLRECPQKVRSRSIGRPGIAVEVDVDHYLTAGVHIGRRITTVALGDLTGRVVAAETIRRAPGERVDLDGVSRRAAALLAGNPGRPPISVGLVGPWRELGLPPGELGAELHDLTGLEVRTADHIAAVAATEFFHRRRGTPGVTLYVYARDTVGFAVATDKGTHTEVSRVGSLTHYPTGSDVPCWCGRTGCLQVTAGDEAVLPSARARLLGEAAASVRDMVAPDRVVLVGQAFTGCPGVRDDITSAFSDTTALGDVPLSFTRFGAGIQAITACTIALGPVYDDPLGVVPRRADSVAE